MRMRFNVKWKGKGRKYEKINNSKNKNTRLCMD